MLKLFSAISFFVLNPTFVAARIPLLRLGFSLAGEGLNRETIDTFASIIEEDRLVLQSVMTGFSMSMSMPISPTVPVVPVQVPAPPTQVTPATSTPTVSPTSVSSPAGVSPIAPSTTSAPVSSPSLSPVDSTSSPTRQIVRIEDTPESGIPANSKSNSLSKGGKVVIAGTVIGTVALVGMVAFAIKKSGSAGTGATGGSVSSGSVV